MRAHIAGRGVGVWEVADVIETRRVVVKLFYWQGKVVNEIYRALPGASAVGRAHCAANIVRVCCRILWGILPIRSRPAHRIDNDIYNHNAAASGNREAGRNRVEGFN